MSRRAALFSSSVEVDHDVIPFSRKKKEKASSPAPAKATKAVAPKVKVENFKLMEVKPLTEGQRQMMFAFKQGVNVVASGSAGTGKTFTASYLALEKLLAKDTTKIVVVRSAVSIRSQGHLPGTQAEKEAIYTVPYKNIVNQLLQCGTAWDSLTKSGMIEFTTTTYIRGLTFDNCVVIIDEFQNFDASEMESALTRIGENSQLIICGDFRQSDLQRKREISCHDWLVEVAKRMPKYFDVINFTHNDIVRSAFVKKLIMTIESMD